MAEKKTRKARRSVPSKAKKSAKPSRVLGFLVDLADSKNLQAQFQTDPRKAMTGAGLLTREQTALLSGDLDRISRLFPGRKIHLPPNTVIKVTLIVIKF
jgi:hypothetical protein